MVEQGNILIIEGISFPCLVISKDTYNLSQMVIACPITNQGDATLAFPISEGSIFGFVQCDDPRRLNLSKRFYTIKGKVSLINLINVINRIESIMDYYL